MKSPSPRGCVLRGGSYGSFPMGMRMNAGTGEGTNHGGVPRQDQEIYSANFLEDIIVSHGVPRQDQDLFVLPIF